MRYNACILTNAALATLGLGSLIAAIASGNTWVITILAILAMPTAAAMNLCMLLKIPRSPLPETARGLQWGANGVCLFTGLIIFINATLAGFQGHFAGFISQLPCVAILLTAPILAGFHHRQFCLPALRARPRQSLPT